MPRDWYRQIDDDVVIEFLDRRGYVSGGIDDPPAASVELARRFDSPYQAHGFAAKFGPYNLRLVYRSRALAEQDQIESAYLEDLRG
jgi:hypothetical protein